MKKLILLGTAVSIYNVPYENELFEIWGTGTTANMPSTKRLDRIYEVHDRATIDWLISDRKCNYNKYKCPVFVRDLDEVNGLIDYPVDFCKEKNKIFKILKREYFTSTVSWMLAHAIIQGYTEITIMQIHLSHESEYFYERPCIEYWIGRAEERGIKVNIPEDSEILNGHYLYGFEKQPISWQKIRSKKLYADQEMESAFVKYVNASAILNQMQGCKSMIELSEKNMEEFEKTKDKINHFWKDRADEIQKEMIINKQMYDTLKGTIDTLDFFDMTGGIK